MKENYTQLYPNEEVTKKVSDYAYEHSTRLPSHIKEHHEWGLTQPMANYMISPLQAEYHIWFAKSIGAKRILEIGTYIGFSALGWSHAVGPDGHVSSLERSLEYGEIARAALNKYGVTNVHVLVGDATSTILGLVEKGYEPFDMIFIDADKVSYPTYLAHILRESNPHNGKGRLLRAGGTIVADNILRRSLVADSSSANPWTQRSTTGEPLKEGEQGFKEEEIEALRKFNKEMVENERLETFLMPLFDGLGMARLKD